ncbi:DUF4276 family protein [Burkholderia gladioli]|uniref:DUF4276 family protein n=1 Tax=Burkholderia gladioli TaxID=28095 RepID=UPI00163F8040|nr:DUF4276 family protein [Burkholderia gladioli]
MTDPKKNKKKIAFFVEGQTEAIFIKQFIFEYLGHQAANVTREQMHGGYIHEIEAIGSPPEETDYEILVVDCQNDERVLTAMSDRHQSLARSGFSHVIGIRDLFPQDLSDLDDLTSDTDQHIAALNSTISIKMIIATMEIESWFLSDPDFFQSIDASLDSAAVKTICGIDFSTVDTQTIDHPASLIEKILDNVSKFYKKREKDTYKILSHLNYTEIFLSGKKRNKSLEIFSDHITAAFK